MKHEVNRMEIAGIITGKILSWQTEHMTGVNTELTWHQAKYGTQSGLVVPVTLYAKNAEQFKRDVTKGDSVCLVGRLAQQESNQGLYLMAWEYYRGYDEVHIAEQVAPLEPISTPTPTPIHFGNVLQGGFDAPD